MTAAAICGENGTSADSSENLSSMYHFIAKILPLRQISEEKNMKSFECTICQYVYDPALGDIENGIAPGTAFEDIPDSWVCPVCGAGKDLFEEL